MTPRTRILMWPALLLLPVACSSGKVAATGTTSSSSPSTAASSTVTSTTTTTPTPTRPTTISVPSGFTAAKQQWLEGATVDSADQGLYWMKAVSDLNAAIMADPSGTTGYVTAVQQLNQLISLPDAMDTPAQAAEAQSDTAALNTFFATPGLYQ